MKLQYIISEQIRTILILSVVRQILQYKRLIDTINKEKCIIILSNLGKYTPVYPVVIIYNGGKGCPLYRLIKVMVSRD